MARELRCPCLCNSVLGLTALVLIKCTLTEAINEKLRYIFSIYFSVFYFIDEAIVRSIISRVPLYFSDEKSTTVEE